MKTGLKPHLLLLRLKISNRGVKFTPTVYSVRIFCILEPCNVTNKVTLLLLYRHSLATSKTSTTHQQQHCPSFQQMTAHQHLCRHKPDVYFSCCHPVQQRICIHGLHMIYKSEYIQV